MTSWHVAKVRTGSETDMHGKCEEIGVESYCPMTRHKGPRRRGEQGREAVERAALPSYLLMRASTVEASDVREELYRDQRFYDFLRDINNAFAEILDCELNPLRAMEKSEPVKFYSGPSFFMGEIVRVPYNSPNVLKAFWGMTGQVVSVKNGRYCLGGHDFTMEAWFNGRQLLANS